MHLFEVFTATLLFAAFANCIAIPASHSVHEKRDSPPREWIKRGRVQPDSVLPIRIGLSQTNLEKGYSFLMEVSDPASPRFGKHWTEVEVDGMFKPDEESANSVIDWLVSSGISRNRIAESDNKSWLAFDATAGESEELLLTEFYEYENSGTGNIGVACEEYFLPTLLQRHVDYITPGIKLLPVSKQVTKRAFSKRPGAVLPMPPLVHILPPSSNAKQEPSMQSTAAPLVNCNQQITPECIKGLYKVPIGTKFNSTNRMGIFEAGDVYSQADLDMFFKDHYPAIPKKTAPKKQLINGAITPVVQSEAGLESDLDFQVAYPLLWPQQTVLYQLGDESSFNTFLDALDGSYCKYEAFGQKGDDPNFDPTYPNEAYAGRRMCGRFKPTNVISVSYGGSEWDLPAYYQQRQCNEFMKLGLMGISVFFASGDSGVAATNGCINGNVFNPVWPATCPYITAVGATKIRPGKKVTDEEAVAQEDENSIFGTFSSGGGFSNVYTVPDYQKKALKTYFSSHNPPYDSYSAFGTSYNPGDVAANGGLYNRLGRGIPDVSANGDNITMIYQGQKALAAGSSASAPMFAAIINRINEERLAAGKSTVGFINPVLYANPGILNDITKGKNSGCGTDGYAAVRGWDPASGLGTPNFPKMLKLWMNLP
ncbi:protease S8 tripeptidyl peptidase I [Leptodontidium sp. 2 PMI_412]|nr:protease S8 tripeptidyl peptidase I [Leptodontidium sp. 2 PMI_412]